MRLTCASSTLSFDSLCCCASDMSSSSGMLSQRKNDSRRREIVVADLVVLTGARHSPAPSRSGTRSTGWTATPAAPRARLPRTRQPPRRCVELHQPVAIVLRQRTTVRLRRQTREDLLGARAFSCAAAVWMAGEDDLAARRLESPVTFRGPMTAISITCGGSVVAGAAPSRSTPSTSRAA